MKELQLYCYNQAWIKRWWADSMAFYCKMRNVQDLLADGKIPKERQFGEPIKGPVIPQEQWLNVTRFQREINQELVNLPWKFFPGSFQALSWSRGECGKGDILIADLEDLEDLEKLDALDIYPRKINAKEVLMTQKEEECIFPVADGTAKMSGRLYEFREPILMREPTVRREDFSRELTGETGQGLNRQNQQMTLKPVAIFLVDSRWFHLSSSERTSEFNSVCQRKKHSLFYWSTWMWPDVRILIWTSCQRSVLTTIGTSIRTEVCQIQKPTLDNARRLRGSCFIDPQDEEYKETIKNARKKLLVRVEAANALPQGDSLGSNSHQELVASLDASKKVPKQCVVV